MKQERKQLLITLLMAIVMMATSPARGWAQTNYEGLCFTAEEAGASVRLVKNGWAAFHNFETSTDGINWSDYKMINNQNFYGAYITLKNVGDKVYFRNKSATAVGSFSNGGGFYQFEVNKKIAASGNVMSLMDKTCQKTDVPADGFKFLFSDCTTLTSAPELPATTLKLRCYESMFNNCTSLTKAPTLPATTLAELCYLSMFNGCSNLKSIKVAFTDWNQVFGSTYGWMEGVSGDGFTFYCKKELNCSKYDPGFASFVPSGATVKIVTEYICELGVGNHKDNKSKAQGYVTGNGFTLVDQDLNGAVGGHYIYMGYKTSYNPADAITDVILVRDNMSDITEITIDSMTYKRATYCGSDGLNGNLNRKASDGADIYLFYTKDPKASGKKSLVTSVSTEWLGSSTTTYDDAAQCWDYKTSTWLGQADMNMGYSGKNICLRMGNHLHDNEMFLIWDGTTCKATLKCRDCGIKSNPVCTVSSVVSKNATCTVNGEHTYTASATDPVTNTTYTSSRTIADIAAEGHKLTAITPAVTVTCTNDGNTAYCSCTACGKYFSGDDTTKEIKENSWIITATGHKLDTQGICSNCHSYFEAPKGDGTAASPYQLSKPGHLVWFSDKTNGLHGLERNMGACAVLTADIDMNSVAQFTPIALYSDTKSSGTYYTGQFNGQGHIIKNLHVYAPDTYEAGMFSRLRYAKVMNLIIENVDVSCSGGTHRAGGLAGLEWTDCVIRNCAVIGNISFTARDGGTLLDGGFLGIYATGTFDQCYTSYHRIDSEAHTTFVRSYYNVAADDARLASGELGYLMNGGVVNGTQGWYQNLGTNGDARPVPDSSHATIYRHTNCDGSGYTCSNSNADNAHTWGINDNGLCAVCKAAYQPCEGDGTDSNPYQITNAGNLIWFSNQQNTLAAGTAMNAKVMNDIKLSGVWNTTIPSIGESVQYAHTFDGQNHTISNLTYRGLFCIVAAGGTVKNVVLDNPRATVDPNYQGSSKNYSANYQSPLVRRNYGTIQECIVKNGQWDTRSLYLGGITGVNEAGAKILRCACYNFNFRSRHGVSTPVGGICAVQCEKALIEDCYTWSTGFTWFTAEQGAGIVHTNSSNATVNNCYSQYATPVYTNSGTTTDVTGSIVADDVIYGRLAYLLNHKKTDGKQAWYEMIADKAETMTDEETGKDVYKETGEEVVRDTFPHLVKDVEKRTVYEVDYTKCNGETVKIYRNTNKAIKQEHSYGTEGDSRFTCINDGCGYVDEDLKAKYSIKPGDVNADTFINIADITALVDIILGKADSTDTADVNGDTKVDIADVTALVNLLFGESQAADE